jgi:hypothetical protein
MPLALELGWAAGVCAPSGRMRRWVKVDDWEWHGCWSAACSADSMAAGLSIHVGVKANYRSCAQVQHRAQRHTRHGCTEQAQVHAPHECALVWLAGVRHEACGPQPMISKRRVQCTGPRSCMPVGPRCCTQLPPNAIHPGLQAPWPSCSKCGPVHTALAGGAHMPAAIPGRMHRWVKVDD